MNIIANPQDYERKESLYINVRDVEGRIVEDDILRKLPFLQQEEPYFSEWSIRAKSYDRFAKYLRKKFIPTDTHILDLGCGNGWFARRLHDTKFKVTAVDLNLTELQQAECVFGSHEGLGWVYADIMNDNIPGAPFQLIVLNASVQYFRDISALTARLKTMLLPRGEIHLLDSIFYKPHTVAPAGQRSHAYYRRMGIPEMAEFYFHHTDTDLRKEGYTKLYPSLFTRGRLQWWRLIIH